MKSQLADVTDLVFVYIKVFLRIRNLGRPLLFSLKIKLHFLVITCINQC